MQNGIITPLFNLFATSKGSIRILRALFELEKKIDQVPLDQNGPGKTPSNVLPGAWLCNLLEDVGLAHTMVRNPIIAFLKFIFYV
jgi:hypothetical protein